jgi:hypothetical protein
MTVDLTRQVRTISTLETGENDPLSVRVKELAWSINNFKAHVGAPTVIPAICFPGTTFQSDDNETDERIMAWLTPSFVPFGYTKLYWQLGTYVDAAGTCTWRWYSVSAPYVGPADFDTSLLAAGYSVSSIATTSTTEEFPAGKTDLDIIRNNDAETWLILTAQCSSVSIHGILTAMCMTGQVT